MSLSVLSATVKYTHMHTHTYAGVGWGAAGMEICKPGVNDMERKRK